MEGTGQGPPAGRGGRGAALLAALKAKQKRPGDGVDGGQEDATGNAQGIDPMPSPSPNEELPSLAPAPVGRAALLSGLAASRSGLGAGVASTVSTPPVGRAALLEKLKIKGAASSTVGSSTAAAGRAQLLASLRGGASVVGSGSGQSHGGTTSPGTIGTGQTPPGGASSPPPGQAVSPTAVAAVSPTSLARPMQGLVLQEEGVGGGGDPVVRKGTAGKTVKLTANYVRLEVEGERGMYEYEVRFEPLVDSRDERFKLVGQQRELDPQGHLMEFSSTFHTYWIKW